MSKRSALHSIFVTLLAYSATHVLIAQSAAAPSPAHPLDLPAVAAVVACPELLKADLSAAVGAETEIQSAEEVSAGTPTPYCKVHVEVAHYAKFDVRLPVTSWRQRLLFGGGFGNTVPDDVSDFVNVSWQDLANRGNEDVFAEHYDLRVNAAYRGMHWQVLAVKALIAKYYGQAQKFSYYNACSEPGREGMMEVQRFPEDFDGVGAGCPPINDVINNGLFYAWNIIANNGADNQPIITADKLPVIHKAVLEQCDGADGLVDGIISDPLNCHPKLAGLTCKPGQEASSCLTAAQVHAGQELYRGAHDAEGHKLEAFGVQPGSEMSWIGVVIPLPPDPRRPINFNDRDGTTYAIRSEFPEPAFARDFKLTDLKWDRATFEAITKTRYLYDATNPDLSAFYKAGHKLILWQAMDDTAVTAAHALQYYAALQQQMGGKTVEEFVRFYTLPGVFHCGGGDGPAIKDFLQPLMLWVERGIAPGMLMAEHTTGGRPMMGPPPPADAPKPKVDMTRPIYPYPYTSQYTGTGDIRDGANFVQGPANPAPAEIFNWLGAGFFKPGYQKWCEGTGTTLTCKDSR